MYNCGISSPARSPVFLMVKLTVMSWFVPGFSGETFRAAPSWQSDHRGGFAPPVPAPPVPEPPVPEPPELLVPLFQDLELLLLLLLFQDPELLLLL